MQFVHDVRYHEYSITRNEKTDDVICDYYMTPSHNTNNATKQSQLCVHVFRYMIQINIHYNQSIVIV